MKKDKKLILLILCFCVGTVTLLVGFNNLISSEANQTYPLAKDFKILNLEGEEIDLHDYNGKLVLLTFWTTWCTNCRKELPILQGLQEKFDKEIQVLAINITYQDDRKAVKQYVKENQLTFPIGLDRFGEVSKAYQVLTMPTSIFISPNGEILRRFSGPLGEEQLETEIKELLKN